MFKWHQNKMNSMGPYERNSFFLTFEGAVGAIIINLVNPFVAMFAKRMGAGDYQIGLLSSLPALIGLFSLIPGALLVDRQLDKKKIVGLHILLTGLLYPLAALTPYLGPSRVTLYIVIIALINWPFSIFNISWQSFFSDVFPKGKRNAAFASRSRAATFFGVVTTLLAGLFLSYFPHSDSQRIMVYQWYFITAFLLALVQIAFLFKVKDYRLPEKGEIISPLQVIKKCMGNLVSNKPFFHFTIIAFFFHIAWQMAWPLFFIYQVDYLHANEAWLSYITVASGLSGVVTFSFWNRMIEKKGGKWVLVIGAVGLAATPILTVASKSLFMLLMMNIATGLTFSAFQLALFENLLEVVPSENKTLNIAIYTSFIGISGFISPMIGVSLYKLTSIYFIMILVTVLRLCGAGLFYIRYRYHLR